MVLIYAYIQRYKNFSHQAFPLHGRYRVDYSDERLSIRYLGRDPIQDMLFTSQHINGLQLVVGKTGSGKTNLFQLLGELEEYRRGSQMANPMFDGNDWARHVDDGAYFFLYAAGENEFYIECRDMRLPQFESVWRPILDREKIYAEQYQTELAKVKKQKTDLQKQIDQMKARGEDRAAKGLEKRQKEKEELIRQLEKMIQSERARASEPRTLFWNAAFTQEGTGLRIGGPGQVTDTMILNCYDRGAFAICPYPDRKSAGYRPGRWILRMDCPYHKATVFNQCRYVLDYIRHVEPGQIKRQARFHISNENFEYAINVPVDDRWAKKLTRVTEDDGEDAKKAFLHNLWVDYGLYLYKKVQQIELFPENEPSEEQRAYQEALDYMQDREHFPFPEAAEMPDPGPKIGLQRLCEKLACHIDYLGDGRVHGLLWQVWSDIKDIAGLLRHYDKKYFTASTFEIPIEEMLSEPYSQCSNDLFERMEGYIPDDSDMFDRYLLPYYFTHLSAGEFQYAKVLGTLHDYLNAPIQEKNDPRQFIVLMDEPDAWLHPELCRQFLKHLIELCRTSKHKRDCQLLISTHSPFFLSDVTSENVLRLEIDHETGQGVVVETTRTPYFAANIHSIMADSFFLDSTIGEYSRSYLMRLQKNLKDILEDLHAGRPVMVSSEWLSTQQKIIGQIGDEIIRGGFQLLIGQIFYERSREGWKNDTDPL